MKHLITFISLTSILFSSLSYANSSEFPGRSEFPDVEIYSKQHLSSNFNQVVIIDTRSNYEFETIHINTSINIPVSNSDFAEQVKEIRRKSNKPIVFYCNGRTCYKSYKATTAAIKNNIKNVFAYDAGMFEWAKTYPDRTTLLGNSPISPADLLSKSVLKSRMLAPEKFSEMAYEMGNKASIIDIRDVTQRANGIGYFVGMEHWISINRKEKIISFLRKANKKNKTLLIYDAVGKQVRWLQYTLEQENIKKYYFMEKGADGFYNQIINVRR